MMSSLLAVLLFSMLFIKSLNATCNALCGAFPYHDVGECVSNGKCRCFVGWTGPNARYLTSTSTIIEADHCSLACIYNPDFRNPSCASEPLPVASTDLACHGDCNLQDNVGGRECSIGYCVCHYGWTAQDKNDAFYFEDGDGGYIVKSRTGCDRPCSWTHDDQPENCATKLN